MQQYLPLAVLKRTFNPAREHSISLSTLQQYLPLAVLKLAQTSTSLRKLFMLQQYLPLAVLKLYGKNYLTAKICCVATVLTACGIETVSIPCVLILLVLFVATVLTACGIETSGLLDIPLLLLLRCNSTYRLRY